MRFITVIFVLLASLAYTQLPDTCFTSEQLLDLDEHVLELERRDSLQTILINEFTYEISQHELLHMQDSSIIYLQEQEIAALERSMNAYKQLYETTRPKWYDHKVIWFVNGFAAVLVSSYIVRNVP